MKVVQERDRIQGVRVVALLLYATLALAASVFVAWLILRATGGADPIAEAPPPGSRPAGEEARFGRQDFISPRAIGSIEQTPIEEVAAGLALRRAQRESLEGWGWADRDAGVARIPIERAMDLVASEAGEAAVPDAEAPR